MDFKQQLTAFKPKQSVLETSIVKSNNADKIQAFRKILDLQKVKKTEASEKQKIQDEYKAIEDEETKRYEEKLISFET